MDLSVWWIIGIFFMINLVSVISEEHPRLFFYQGDISKLREKVKREPYKSMMEHLQVCIDKGNWGVEPYNPDNSYDQSTRAQRTAFLYILTGDDKWAKMAREVVEKRINDPKEWANPKIKGLTLYWHGSKIAMTYDWCYGAPSWDKEFCQKVSIELKRHGDVILRSGGTEQNTNPASNWQGGRFASAGLCFLASDENINPADIDTCYQRVCRYLTENLGNSKDSRGWNIEGLGYTYYPMGNFVGPFGIAMARKDPSKDIRTISSTRWTYWTVYAVLSKALGNIRPDFGDDNPGTAGEGTFGQAFYYAPEELIPGIKYWYDRVWGLKGNKTFDQARGGTIWSILYYPENIPEKDPMQIDLWRAGFVDTGGNGFMTYRNRYQDADDMIAQIYLKLRGNKGHNGPDALSFRIIGLGTAFAVGGGRYGPKLNGMDAYLRSMNTLYPVDPDENFTVSAQSGKIIGQPVIKPDGSGHVVAYIPLNNLGVKNHKRWFIADYSPNSGADAVYVIVDSSENGYYWQLCTISENTITTQKNSFLITAPNGSTMQGVFLYPSDIQLKTGKRIRGSNYIDMKENNFVHAKSNTGNWIVVLTCVKKNVRHPIPVFQGNFTDIPKGTVKINNFKVNIDGDQIMY